MDEIMDSFIPAEQGKSLWLEIKAKYGYQNGDLLLLLPTDCDEMNRAAIQYIPVYIKNKYIRHAFVVYRKNAAYFEVDMPYVTDIELPETQLLQLVALYKLIQFEKNIVAVIPELPFASVGILGKNGITAEDYVINTFFEKVGQ